jgi:hypothetical protein
MLHADTSRIGLPGQLTGVRRMASSKIYIHEIIEIIGSNRAKYMHHMSAVWAPVRREHEQSCLGVWAEVGTTGNWPRVVNMWEHDGWQSLAFHLGYEASGKKSEQSSALGKMEPAEAEWWQKAADFRRGGRDRILVPTPWTRTVDELVADGVRGGLYAHERIWTDRNRSPDYIKLLEDHGLSAYQAHGLEIIGAYDNALINARECFVLWAIPDWPTWAAFESAWASNDALIGFRRRSETFVDRFERRILTDNPLNPMVLGRQPHEDDRRPMSEL